ncbi:MAG: NifU family protein [Pseudomonadota bacterium]
MFIKTEDTPNPETLKFIPGQIVSPNKNYSFNDLSDAKNISPLAIALFETDLVKTVFFGDEFISITKLPEHNWDFIKAEILSVITEHFLSGQPTIIADQIAGEESGQQHDDAADDDSEVVKEIKGIIDQKVRPAVAQDGGDIIFRGFNEETGVVLLEMQGACSGCPSSTITLKNGVERLLNHYIPAVTMVEEYYQ